MAEYDLIIKALVERYKDQIASFVRGVAVSVEQVEDKDKEAVAVQRTSDVLLKVREDGYQYLMLVEFQSRPDRKMAMRLLEYTAMHHRRHEVPVYPVVINLTGGGRQEGRYILECLDLPVVNFNYRQINLQDIAGRDFLYRGPVGLLPLVPLMRQDESLEAVLEKCVSRLKDEIPGDEDRSILYLALGAFASLKFSRDLILKLMEVNKLDTFPLFDGVREKWIDQGIHQGIHQGIVDAIMEALKENTGHYPGNLAEKLKTIDDVDTLKNLLRRAIKAKSIEEFEAGVKELIPN
ncbi:MAG: Rpn family recombination-promoting nuclease/putative transposase [Actinobacteria bacterium]|nr:Rpn family recombination-promoting nuclease/putative transposase [Actinomycetota bacterium]